MIGVTPGFEPTAVMLCKSLAESGPVTVDEFDDAWTPAGDTYRSELVSGGLAEFRDEPDDADRTVPWIVLTAAGVALASGQAPVAAESAPPL